MNKSTTKYCLINVFGMLCFVGYVWGARHLAITDGRESYDLGDSAGFILVVVPVLLLSIVVNIIWTVVALRAILRNRTYQSAVVLVIVIALWAGVFPVARELAQLPSHQAQQQMPSSTVELAR
jgi:hypothetical protein